MALAITVIEPKFYIFIIVLTFISLPCLPEPRF